MRGPGGLSISLRDAETIELSFDGQEGTVYDVERTRRDLALDIWEAAGSVTCYQDERMALEIPRLTSAPTEFFRVRWRKR